MNDALLTQGAEAKAACDWKIDAGGCRARYKVFSAFKMYLISRARAAAEDSAAPTAKPRPQFVAEQISNDLIVDPVHAERKAPAPTAPAPADDDIDDDDDDDDDDGDPVPAYSPWREAF